MRRGERVRSAAGGLTHAQGGCAEVAVRARSAAQSTTATQVEPTATMEDARAYATWAAMEREFSLGRGAASGRLLLPRHSRARFIELLEWMALDRERRTLMPVVLAATSLYTRQTRLSDWGGDAGVRARADELMGGGTRGTPYS